MSKFQVTQSPLDGVKVIEPRAFEDARGWFMETYARSDLTALGINTVFVQDNHSLSFEAGTVRGLHYQRAPFAQEKLVRCLTGRIWDVAVDIRRGSPTFGQGFGLELSAANRLQLLVPVGFAHGFMTLEPDTQVAYKVSAAYSVQHDAGIRWDDPSLAIEWPTAGLAPTMSDRDARLPLLAEAAVS